MILSSIRFHIKYINNHIFYKIFIIIVYIALVFVDPKTIQGANGILIKDYDVYVQRLLFQQLTICFASILLTAIVLNEKYLKIVEEVILIKGKHLFLFFETAVITLILLNCIPFIIGNIIFALINGLLTEFIPMKLLLSNAFVVCCEISSLVLLGAGLIFFFSKTTIATCVFFALLFILMLSHSNIFTIPLTARQLITQRMYYNFPTALPIGRIILLLVAFLFWKLCLLRFIKNKSNM